MSIYFQVANAKKRTASYMVTGKDTQSDEKPKAKEIEIFGRRFEMPRSRLLRIVIGCLLILFGIFGFLPVLGFWMIPLGLLVLSYEFAMIRRLRRKAVVKYSRRQKSD